MCRSRKGPSTITIIRDIYKTYAPSTTTGLFVFIFILVSVVLLGVTLLPPIPIYETDFTGLNSDITIVNGSQFETFRGVKNISWGTWRACYHNDDSVNCTNTEWISNPYNFTIKNGDIQVSVQQLWLRVMFLQLIGLIFAVFIVFVLVLRMCCLSRQAVRYSAANINPGKQSWCNTTNLLTAFLWVWITIVVICSIAVVYSIQKEMQLLGPEVNTQPAPGFWLPVAADAFIFVTVILVVCLVKQNVIKSKEIVTIQSDT